MKSYSSKLTEVYCNLILWKLCIWCKVLEYLMSLVRFELHHWIMTVWALWMNTLCPCKMFCSCCGCYRQRHSGEYHPGHDDVITWKHLLNYWPFVKGIHQLPVDSPHNRWVIWGFNILVGIRLYTMMSWFGNAFRITGPLWREPPMTGRLASQKVRKCKVLMFTLMPQKAVEQTYEWSLICWTGMYHLLNWEQFWLLVRVSWPFYSTVIVNLCSKG